VDGKSSDRTMEIVRSYSKRIETVLSERDDGIYDAMNKGIRLASGDLIAILNADDEYADQHVISKLASRLGDPTIDAVYGDLIYVDRHHPNRVTRKWVAGPYREGAFSRGWVPPHPTFVCRKAVYERLGSFDTRLQVAADFELMLRFMAINHIRVAYLNEVLVKMRTGGRASQISGMIQGNREILHAFKTHGLPFPWALGLCRPVSRIQQIIQGRRVTRAPLEIVEVSPGKAGSTLEPLAKTGV
jgi:glycosyltransferase